MSKFSTSVSIISDITKVASSFMVSAGSGSVAKSALMSTAPAKNKYVQATHYVGAWALGSLMAEKSVDHVNEQIDSATEKILQAEVIVDEYKRKANRTPEEKKAAKSELKEFRATIRAEKKAAKIAKKAAKKSSDTFDKLKESSDELNKKFEEIEKKNEEKDN